MKEEINRSDLVWGLNCDRANISGLLCSEVSSDQPALLENQDVDFIFKVNLKLSPSSSASYSSSSDSFSFAFLLFLLLIIIIIIICNINIELNGVFQLLEKKIVKFVKSHLKMFHRVLTQDAESVEGLGEDEEVMNDEEKEHRRSSSEAFLKITVHFLKGMKHRELADNLQRSKKQKYNSFSLSSLETSFTWPIYSLFKLTFTQKERKRENSFIRLPSAHWWLFCLLEQD